MRRCAARKLWKRQKKRLREKERKMKKKGKERIEREEREYACLHLTLRTIAKAEKEEKRIWRTLRRNLFRLKEGQRGHPNTWGPSLYQGTLIFWKKCRFCIIAIRPQIAFSNFPLFSPEFRMCRFIRANGFFLSSTWGIIFCLKIDFLRSGKTF